MLFQINRSLAAQMLWLLLSQNLSILSISLFFRIECSAILVASCFVCPSFIAHFSKQYGCFKNHASIS